MATLSLARWIPGAAMPLAWAPVQAPAGLPAPDADSVLLLAAHLESPAPDDETAHYTHFLTGEERVRVDRFRVDIARRRLLVGRGLVRGVLGHCLHCPPLSVPLVEGPHGKPALDPEQIPDPIQFNLSHSGSLVLIAFTRRGELGVDVECIRKRMLIPEIMDRQFHPDERAVVADDPDFFRCWAIKEAVVKGFGRGLGYPTASFSVAPLLRGEREQVLTLDDRAWRCAELAVEGEGYSAALAVEEPA